MQRISLPVMFGCWVIILVIELFSLFGLLHRVHDQEEVLFYFTIIAVTLVVGTVGLVIASKIDGGSNRMKRL